MSSPNAERSSEELLDDARRWWSTDIIDIEPGKIHTRGYPIQDLIGNVTFPEMIWLMLRGELPTRPQSRLFEAFERSRCNYLIVALKSDWLFPSSHSWEMAEVLLGLERNVSFCELDGDGGHVEQARVFTATQ